LEGRFVSPEEKHFSYEGKTISPEVKTFPSEEKDLPLRGIDIFGRTGISFFKEYFDYSVLLEEVIWVNYQN
jgi:hypothetical protein